jgi:hypothetical protein
MNGTATSVAAAPYPQNIPTRQSGKVSRLPGRQSKYPVHRQFLPRRRKPPAACICCLPVKVVSVLHAAPRAPFHQPLRPGVHLLMRQSHRTRRPCPQRSLCPASLRELLFREQRALFLELGLWRGLPVRITFEDSVELVSCSDRHEPLRSPRGGSSTMLPDCRPGRTVRPR